jgi:hypothetical protein
MYTESCGKYRFPRTRKNELRPILLSLTVAVGLAFFYLERGKPADAEALLIPAHDAARRNVGSENSVTVEGTRVLAEEIR